MTRHSKKTKPIGCIFSKYLINFALPKAFIRYEVRKDYTKIQSSLGCQVSG